MNTIAAANAPFGNTGVMVSVPAGGESAYPASVQYLRAISPVTVSGAGSSLNTYFDADIATAYSVWQSTPLITNDVSTGYYTGVVFPVNGPSIAPPANYPAGSIAFYAGQYKTMQDLATALNTSPPPPPAFYLTGSSVNVVTSNDIWQCVNSLASGSPAQKNVGKMIGAAFNRGAVVSATGSVITSLDDGTCSGLVSSFYASGTTCNLWSQWFQQYNTNGLAYGFPYDDVCDQNPSIPPLNQTLVASFIRITLGNFSS